MEVIRGISGKMTENEMKKNYCFITATKKGRKLEKIDELKRQVLESESLKFEEGFGEAEIEAGFYEENAEFFCEENFLERNIDGEEEAGSTRDGKGNSLRSNKEKNAKNSKKPDIFLEKNSRVSRVDILNELDIQGEGNQILAGLFNEKGIKNFNESEVTQNSIEKITKKEKCLPG